MRFRALMDITQPLRRGMHIRVEGEKLWVPFSYESVLIFCFNCGKLGHFFKACSDHDRDNDSELSFSSTLKAIARKRRNPTVPGTTNSRYY